MGKFFEEMALRHKLMVMLSVFAIGFVWISFGRVSGAIDRQAEAAELMELANFSVTIGALVHELQKERAMSAGHLGSGGSMFARDLDEQRRLADNRLADLTVHIENAAGTAHRIEFASAVRAAVGMLGALDGMRVRVSAMDVAVEDAIEFYTGLNSELLNVVGIFPKLSTVGNVNNSGLAYVAFLQSKEHAGIEAAVLSSAFVRDEISRDSYDRFQSLVSAQRVYLETFQTLSSAAQNGFYTETLSARSVDETARMRKIAVDNAVFGGFGIDAADWLRMQGEKLGLLKEVEDKLSVDLRAQISDVRSDAAAEVRFMVLVSLGILGYGVVFGYAMAQTILSQLGADPQRLKDIVNSIANDDLHLELDSDKPATGVFADVLHMQEKLRSRINADRDALAVNSRIRQALNNVDGNVMIADTDRKIVYMNDAITALFYEAQMDIRRDLPDFDASRLLGSNIDNFIKDRSTQSSFLGDVMDEHVAEIMLGGRTMKIVVNPVFGQDGSQLGAVVEWTDRTQEVAMENEVHKVVGCALAGDLSSRISLDRKEGFFRQLSENINQLVDVAECVINDTLRVLGAMASGNLDETIDAEYKGSFGELKHHANVTVKKLTDVVGGIRESASSVRTGVEEISQGNLNLSQRTEEQASSLEETAASMEQMTSTVRQNAENAVEANQLAKSAREQAEKGGAVVSRAVVAMREINDSSKKISDIIGVIDEIAFQTNLLALNASVEAARAGEQGRGFAVVASEVRNLAGRSATAAREIKDLIVDSGGKVDEGSRLVNESGEMLDEIVTGVKQVTDIVGEIAAASQEQSAGISEVSKAIMQMDELTQQNAALVEEAAAASESLGKQANDLNHMMAFFCSDTVESFGKSRYEGAERRTKKRPWSGPAAKENAGEPAARQAVAGGPVEKQADQEWEEF